MDERLALKGGAKKLPRINKAVLTVISLLLLFIANFRFGFSVTVAENELEGVFAPRELLAAVAAAEAAAGEITGGEVNLRGSFVIRPRLIMGGYSKDTATVEKALLETSPKIARLCAVRVDGEFLGWVREQSDLGELLDSLLSEKCGIYTISAGFTKKITAQYSYAPVGASLSAMEISRIIRDMDIVRTIEMNPQETALMSVDGIVY